MKSGACTDDPQQGPSNEGAAAYGCSKRANLLFVANDLFVEDY